MLAPVHQREVTLQVLRPIILNPKTQTILGADLQKNSLQPRMKIELLYASGFWSVAKERSSTPSEYTVFMLVRTLNQVSVLLRAGFSIMFMSFYVYVYVQKLAMLKSVLVTVWVIFWSLCGSVFGHCQDLDSHVFRYNKS